MLVFCCHRTGNRVDGPAVYSDGSVVSKLLLSFVHLTDELDERFAAARYAVFSPVSEVKLTNGA